MSNTALALFVHILSNDRDVMLFPICPYAKHWHTGTHCNAVHHAAMHCILSNVRDVMLLPICPYAKHCHTGTHCNTVHHAATHCILSDARDVMLFLICPCASVCMYVHAYTSKKLELEWL